MKDIPPDNHPRLTPWERMFLDGVRPLKKLSLRQLAILDKILTKCAPPKITVTHHGDHAKPETLKTQPVRTVADIDDLLKGVFDK